jgi:hypothetical protein
MSMDFVYDLKEKLEEQNLEYSICIIKPLKKDGETKIEIFYDIKTDESFDSMCDAFDAICKGEIGDNLNIEHDTYLPEQTPTPTPHG